MVTVECFGVVAQDSVVSGYEIESVPSFEKSFEQRLDMAPMLEAA